MQFYQIDMKFEEIELLTFRTIKVQTYKLLKIMSFGKPPSFMFQMMTSFFIKVCSQQYIFNLIVCLLYLQSDLQVACYKKSKRNAF